MPYTESDYPAQIKDLPKHGREIWVAAFNSAYKGYDPEKDQQYDSKKSKAKNRDAYAARVAWGAVKRKYKKDADGKWVAKALSFNVAIVKTVIKNGQRRYLFTGSSDSIDLLEERLDPSIFDDFVYNFGRGYPGPVYVDIAHWSYYYPELRSLVRTGEVDQLYRDGRYIKGWAFDYEDNPFAEASWEQIRRAARGELDFEISCSLGFMPDYGNVGYENGVFTYRGGRNKAYMDHLAKTAFPANPDAEIVPEEVAMATKSTKGPTLAEDAQRVLGDPQLVEELEEARKNTTVQKTVAEEGIVIKAEEGAETEEVDEEKTDLGEEEGEPEDVEELEPEPEEEPEPVVEMKAATDAEVAAQKKRAKASGIAVKEDGNVTMPKKWRDENVPDSNTSWGDWANYKLPLHKEENVRNASSRIAQDKTRKGYSAAELSKIEGRIDKAKKKFKIGEYKEKAVTKQGMEYRPYGGATSINEAQEYLEAAEDRAKVWDHWYLFQSVAENILIDEQIEDKRAAMVGAISDFKGLIETKSQIAPPEAPAGKIGGGEVKAVTEEQPAADQPAEAPAPAVETLEPEVKAETEPQPSAQEQGARVARSFAQAVEMILGTEADTRTKRAAMGEALVQTASALEAMIAPEPKPAPQVDTDVIVKAIEMGFERAMAKVMEQLGSQGGGEKPLRPQRKSVVPSIQPSSIITKGQNFGEIVDRLLGGA
jgi:cation transport regulator